MTTRESDYSFQSCGGIHKAGTASKNQHSTFTASLTILLLCGVAMLASCSSDSSSPNEATYSIGGEITGLTDQVVLQNNGGDNLSLSANGDFTFANALTAGSTYTVTVLEQPAGQTCTVTNGSGTVDSADITNIAVACNAPNADLVSLNLSSGTLDQIFQGSQFDYTSTQGFLVTSLQVTATAADAGAEVTINGALVASGQASQAIALAAGDETVITIVVTAADRMTTQTYTVAITRQSVSDFVQQAYVKASNTESDDTFGWSIALSGDGHTLAVGALFEDNDAIGINNGDPDNNDAPDSGAVYVFTRTDDEWSQQAYIKASNTGANDFFGWSLALSGDGDTLAVGAPLEDSDATGVNNGDPDNNNAPDSGAVYVFTRTGGEWNQQVYVKASNTGASDLFGGSVALSADGHTLAIGAHFEGSDTTDVNNGNPDNNDAPSSGAVYVFVRINGEWNQQAYVKASNTESADTFGWSLALSGDGDTLAAGAPGEDSHVTGANNANPDNNDAPDSGAIYVFTRTDDEWSQQAYIKASNTGANDFFGGNLALSGDGDTLAVGAHFEGSYTTGVNSGDPDNNDAHASGAVYVFTRTDNEWNQQAYVKASNTGFFDQFGYNVALSGDGNTLAVGAINENNNADNDPAFESGAVYVFTRTSSEWSQQAHVKASNAGAFDQFGFSVAVSNDGTLAVGAPFENSNAIGIGGPNNDDAANSGAVYIYQ